MAATQMGTQPLPPPPPTTAINSSEQQQHHHQPITAIKKPTSLALPLAQQQQPPRVNRQNSTPVSGSSPHQHPCHHHHQLSSGGNKNTASAALLQQHHHHQRLGVGLDGVQSKSAASTPTNSSPVVVGGGANSHAHQQHYKGHQRRQSVARLLPDISKLRLLSWLVEASSELINCDIAIMDGVYAKLNRSQESLLFWNSTTTTHATNDQSPTTSVASYNINNSRSSGNSQQLQQQLRPAVPPIGPVANKRMLQISSMQQQQQKLKKQEAAARNHHSLPLPNYDASSIASSSFLAPYYLATATTGATTASVASSNTTTTSTTNKSSSNSSSGRLKQPTSLLLVGNSQTPACDKSDELLLSLVSDQHNCASDEDDDDEDDDNSSAGSSSTTSSGIHNASLSSDSSNHSSSNSSSSDSSFFLNEHHHQPSAPPPPPPPIKVQPALSSAQQLSEKIRRTVTQHNYLQNLLVNIIRQHDSRRDSVNQQRRRQMSADGRFASPQHHHQAHYATSANHQQRIDLADIADALDDGCLCVCHSQPLRSRTPSGQQTKHQDKSATLPSSIPFGVTSSCPSSKDKKQQKDNINQVSLTSSTQQQQQTPPARKARRLKQKIRGSSSDAGGELNREDLINLLSDKLCENCFETHYWLHGCSLDLSNPQQIALSNINNNIKQDLFNTTSSSSSTATLALSSSAARQDLNSVIAKRNATFIKLVQQEVRSTISKSIELIDLIRKEIKLPESIKQKQLMRCFSSSIQLLTSVGNYVVPAQDISSFIPDVIGQQQTTLFSLPSSDFDHLLLYPTTSINNNQQQQTSNYHLASAPDLPIRRRGNCLQQQVNHSLQRLSVGEGRTQSVNNSPTTTKILSSTTELAHIDKADSLKSDTIDNTINSIDPNAESSSGASSNNSSASSSIARGAVQQSSLTRAQTSSDILVGKTSHDLSSIDAIVNLTRQQTEDDSIFNFPGQRQQKFWQSSKFNFIKKLLHVKQQRLLRQQSKDRRIYNNKVQNKFRLVMMDLTHFNKSQQLLTTENGVNSLLTSMRNVLEFGLYLTLKLY